MANNAAVVAVLEDMLGYFGDVREELRYIGRDAEGLDEIDEIIGVLEEAVGDAIDAALEAMEEVEA